MQGCSRVTVWPPSPVHSHPLTWAGWHWATAVALLLWCSIFFSMVTHFLPLNNSVPKCQLYPHRMSSHSVPTSLARAAPGLGYPHGPSPISKPILWQHLYKHSMLLPPAYFLVPLTQLFSKAVPKAPHSYINHLWFAADKSLKSRPFKTNSSITSFGSQTHDGCIKGNYPQPCPIHHQALSSTSLSAWFAPSSTRIHREMVLWLTPSWDPQEKKYRLVILPCICCELSWYHAPNQTCACQKANSQTGQLLQKITLLAGALPWLPLPTKTGISGELSAAEICLEISMSFQKKLFTPFGCTSNSNTSSLYHLDLFIYTCYINSQAFWNFCLSYIFFCLMDFLITLRFWPFPTFLSSPGIRFLSFWLQRKLQNWNLSKYVMKSTLHDVLVEWSQYFNLLNIF